MISKLSRQSISWDAIALVSITLVGLVCHTVWARLQTPLVLASTALMTLALSGFTAWMWPRVALWLTKFFCIAAVFDLAAEGVLRPYHGDTATTKLICQMTLFGAYAIYLVLLRPVDVWIAHRRSAALKRLAIVLFALLCRSWPSFAQSTPMLQITVEREQKTGRATKQRGEATQRGNAIYIKPQVTDSSKAVVLSIRMRNLNAAHVEPPGIEQEMKKLKVEL